MVIRVLIADDQAMVAGALAALLSLESDIQVVGQVRSGTEVQQAAIANDADVCLMDVQMPGLDGIAATESLKAARPQTKVLIVTTFNRAGYLRRGLSAGARGFLVKDTPAEELAAAVRRVYRGELVVDPALQATLLLSEANPLSPREQEVLRLSTEGEPISAIAERVHLSKGTVRNLLSAAISKTRTANRVQAAQTASERGWI